MQGSRFERRLLAVRAAALVEANQPPQKARFDFEIDGDLVGSIEQKLAEALVQEVDGLALEGSQLSLTPRCGPDSSAVLRQMACWLHDHGHIQHWRNELLRVTGQSGQVRAMVERAAARALGIRTFAVHLNAFVQTPGESLPCLWVQQRALNKATDPGKWDTTVGGLVAGDESFALSLEREAFEEAGLDITALRKTGCEVTTVESLRVQRPLPEGFMVEELLSWEIDLPPTYSPVNQDGEVFQFALWPFEQVLEGLEQGQFTLEAQLVLTTSLLARLKRREDAHWPNSE